MALFKKLFSFGSPKTDSSKTDSFKTDSFKTELSAAGLSTASSPEPRLEQFAALVIQEIHKLYPAADSVFLSEKKAIQIYYRSCDCHIVIDNVFADWTAVDNQDRAEYMRCWVESNFAQFASEIVNDFNEIANGLMPGIRTRSGLEIRQLQLKLDAVNNPEDIPSEICAIADSLVLEFLVDQGSTMRTANVNDYKRWNVSLEDVRSIAIANLWKMSDEAFTLISPGVWQSPWQDHYDASRILLVDKLRELSVQGDTVVFIPSRDHLLVVGSDDVEAFEKVVLTSEMVLSKSSRPLTGLPYVIKEDGLEVFSPSTEHPAYGLVQRAEYYSRALDYSMQKRLLEKIFELENIDIFVASYTVKQLDSSENSDKKKEESLHSTRYSAYCVWSEGITSWLPKAEEVVFCRADSDGQFGAIGTARWEACQDRLSPNLHRIDSYPERWEVKEFPTDEELEALSLIDRS